MSNPTIVPQEALTDGSILIVDVDYRNGYAVASGVIIEDWDSTECAVINSVTTHIEEYNAGLFYQRELPCILNLMKHLTVDVACIIVDGYVHLGAAKSEGLGAKLHQATKTPVIGVAKTYFTGTPDECRVLRGTTATKPLFVTSIGGDEAAARDCILTMEGKFRIPTMLKFVDHLCRTYQCTSPQDSV